MYMYIAIGCHKLVELNPTKEVKPGSTESVVLYRSFCSHLNLTLSTFSS